MLDNVNVPKKIIEIHYLVIHGRVVLRLQNFFIAPDPDLLCVRPPRDAGVGGAVNAVFSLEIGI